MSEAESPEAVASDLGETELEKKMAAAVKAEEERLAQWQAETEARRAALDENIQHYIPLNGYVLLRRAMADEKSAGGILLPDAAKQRPEEGLVIAIGNGRVAGDGTRIPMTVRKGDRVVFAPFTGHPVPRYGTDYMLIDEAQVLAIAERDPAPTSV